MLLMESIKIFASNWDSKDKRHMYRHLVAVKVCVKGGTDQRMYFYGFTFD